MSPSGRRTSSLKDLDGVPWRRLHLWQIQPLRDILLIAAVFGLLYLGYKISLVTVPLLLALLLAYLFEPVVEWLTHKFGWITRRMAAGGLIAAVAIVVIVPLSIAAAWGIAEGTRFAIRQADNAANFVLFVNRTFPPPDPAKTEQKNGEQNKGDSKNESQGTESEQPSALSEAAPLLVGNGTGSPGPSEDGGGDGASTNDEGPDKVAASEDAEESGESAEKEPDLVDALEVASEAAQADSETAAEALTPPIEIKTAGGGKMVIRDDGTVEEFDQDGKRPAEFYYNKLTSDAWRWTAELLEDKKGDPAARKAAALIGSMDPMPSMAQVRSYISGIVTSIAASISLIGLFGFQLFLTAFFFFFVSSNYERVIDFIENLLPEKKKDRIVDLAQKMDKVIAGFVRGRLVIALIQGTIFSVAYLLMGVPAAILLGFAVGVLSIVPYLALIGIPISMLLLLLDGPDSGFRSAWWFTLLAPVIVYFVVQALDDYVWTPLIQGKSTGLDTPTVLFASIAGGALAGFYGLLIAIPVAACLKILVQEVVWPRFKDWREGKVEDPLPLGGGG